MTQDPSSLTIACLQFEPVFANSSVNRAALSDRIVEAANAGAKLIVAPELCVSGYAFQSRDQAISLSEPADGPTAQSWQQLADAHGVHIVGGICERQGDILFNSALLVGPGGYVRIYRKLHLWGQENLVFESGHDGLPVFETALGRIGILICYDQWFPETYRALALGGADIVCVPTAWMPIPGQDAARDAMANIVAMAAAHSNGISIACAARIGRENGQPFVGNSLIVSGAGWPLGGPASADTEEIVYGAVNLTAQRQRRRWSPYNHILHDRRPDAYTLS